LDFNRGVKDNHVGVLLIAHELIKEIKAKTATNEKK
jgi:hypothetical protein